jgi:hypothetical protein
METQEQIKFDAEKIGLKRNRIYWQHRGKQIAYTGILIDLREQRQSEGKNCIKKHSLEKDF